MSPYVLVLSLGTFGTLRGPKGPADISWPVLEPSKASPVTSVRGRFNLSRGQTEKAHQLFQHKLFAPHPKHPFLGPQKRVYVPHFLGKDAKKGPTLHSFRGIFGSKKGVPNRPFSATTSLVYSFFLPLLRLPDFAS